MPTQELHGCCEDCVKKDRCEFKPETGRLIRCLDKQTAEKPCAAEAPANA